MNREIKFRVWDKQNKNFANTKDINWGEYWEKSKIRHAGEGGELLMDFDGDLRIATYPCGNGDNSADSVFDNINNQDNYIIQQFTGLKDINDKEIYEGDIVYGEVDFREFNEDGYSGDVYSFQDAIVYRAPFFTCESADFPLCDYTTLEVLGNVFENPELLGLKIPCLN